MFIYLLICEIFLFHQLYINIVDTAKLASTTTSTNKTNATIVNDPFEENGKFSNYSLATVEQRKQIIATDNNAKLTDAQKQTEFDKIFAIIKKDLQTKLAAIANENVGHDDDEGEDMCMFSGKYYFFIKIS